MKTFRCYRKKPLVVEAWRYEDISEASLMLDWVGANDGEAWMSHGAGPAQTAIVIETMEGRMYLRLGNWLICGVQGEFYACEHSIFEQTYELASEPSPATSQSGRR